MIEILKKYLHTLKAKSDTPALKGILTKTGAKLIALEARRPYRRMIRPLKIS